MGAYSDNISNFEFMYFLLKKKNYLNVFWLYHYLKWCFPDGFSIYGENLVKLNSGSKGDRREQLH